MLNMRSMDKAKAMQRSGSAGWDTRQTDEHNVGPEDAEVEEENHNLPDGETWSTKSEGANVGVGGGVILVGHGEENVVAEVSGSADGGNQDRCPQNASLRKGKWKPKNAGSNACIDKINDG